MAVRWSQIARPGSSYAPHLSESLDARRISLDAGAISLELSGNHRSFQAGLFAASEVAPASSQILPAASEILPARSQLARPSSQITLAGSQIDRASSQITQGPRQERRHHRRSRTGAPSTHRRVRFKGAPAGAPPNCRKSMTRARRRRWSARRFPSPSEELRRYAARQAAQQHQLTAVMYGVKQELAPQQVADRP